MKRIEANRYPNSAALFRFCKEALATKSKGKVIDQDVGGILGYDPADCSHWKKGKKNVRTLNVIKTIAEHLNADERLIVDIASGSIDVDEAIYEYKGYGLFEIPTKVLDELKKDFFKNPSGWQKNAQHKTFEEVFDVNRQVISRLSSQIVEKGQFQEAPLYVPEVFQLFANTRLVHNPHLGSHTGVHRDNNQMVQFSFADQNMRPFTRFLLFKDLFLNVIAKEHNLSENHPIVLDIQANIFASTLIVPARMIKNEISKIDANFDLVTQLSERFWVSKYIMNQRLRDYLSHGI